MEGWGTTTQKAEEGWWQKCSGYTERCTTNGSHISGRRAARIFSDFTEGHKNLGTNSTSTIHKSCVKRTSDKTKVDRWIKYKLEVPHQRSPHAVKSSRTDLRRRLKDKSDAPAETRGDLPRTSSKLKEKGKSCILFAIRLVEFCCQPRIHNKTLRKESLWWTPDARHCIMSSARRGP